MTLVDPRMSAYSSGFSFPLPSHKTSGRALTGVLLQSNRLHHSTPVKTESATTTMPCFKKRVAAKNTDIGSQQEDTLYTAACGNAQCVDSPAMCIERAQTNAFFHLPPVKQAIKKHGITVGNDTYNINHTRLRSLVLFLLVSE